MLQSGRDVSVLFKWEEVVETGGDSTQDDRCSGNYDAAIEEIQCRAGPRPVCMNKP